jgi:hypothetical protein
MKELLTLETQINEHARLKGTMSRVYWNEQNEWLFDRKRRLLSTLPYYVKRDHMTMLPSASVMRASPIASMT